MALPNKLRNIIEFSNNARMFARVESRHNRINVTSMENFIVLSFSQKPKKPRQGIRVNRCLKLAGENPPLKGALGMVFEGI